MGAPAHRGTGMVVWLTGLPGAGKTTIAGLVERDLRPRGCPVEVLDGDELRGSLSQELGFSRRDRDIHVRRIAFVADLLSRNGVVVLVAAIAPYRDTREDSRRLMGARFLEVYVKASSEACARRDVKGLYSRARAGEIRRLTGVSDPYEEPLSPDLMLDTETEGPRESAARVVSIVLDRRGSATAAAP